LNRTIASYPLLRNTGVLVGVVLAVMAAFFAVSVVAFATSGTHQQSAIRAAIADGGIDYGFRWPFGPPAKNNIYNFNDCLIFNMLVFPKEGDLLSRAISPRAPLDSTVSAGGPAGFPPYQQCSDLKAHLSAVDGGRNFPSYLYHRYLHGDWVLCEILLGFLSVFAASRLLMTILLLQLAALALVPIWRAMRNGDSRGRDIAYSTVAIVLTVFWAIPAYDWSFSFAPGDIVIVSFLLLFYVRPPSSMTEAGFVATCTAFGGLTAIFEFLTGGIPGGLAVLLAVLVFDAWPDRQMLLRRAALAVTSFAAAIVLCFAFKAAAVVAIWGPQELFKAAAVLSGHLGSVGWDLAPDKVARLQRYGVTVEAIRSSRALSTLYGLFKMAFFTSNMAWGSLLLGIFVSTLLPFALAIRQAFAWKGRDPTGRVRIAILLLSGSIPLLWCCVFVQHTIASAHFMFRILVWPPAILLAAELSQRAWKSAAGRPARLDESSP
jgi:hypothetical protein